MTAADPWARLERDFAEQLAGIAAPVMHEPANRDVLREATPVTTVFPNHEGSEL